ncbi:hypothetical protein SFRURICE_015315 [Spodoptera frugiperda]|nr:hypothetical protein SFRURICE_015315 [Spodoptera frugiperda]
MIGFRSLVSSATRSKGLFKKLQHIPIPKHRTHVEGPPQPFDNLPFSVINRYVATVFFAFVYGIGLWAPFIIIWYAMAKKLLRRLPHWSSSRKCDSRGLGFDSRVGLSITRLFSVHPLLHGTNNTNGEKWMYIIQ